MNSGKVYLSDLQQINFEELQLQQDMPLHHSKHCLVRLKNDSKKIYIYRNQSPNLALEQFNADCYHLLLGYRSPRLRLVINQHGKCSGFLTELYPGYHSFQNIITSRRGVTKEALSGSGIGLLWSAGILEQDKNFTLNSTGVVFGGYQEIPQCVRMHSSEKQREYNEHQFPLLAAMEEPAVSNDAHYIFLMRTLIPFSTHITIGNRTIEDKNLRKKVVQEKIKDTIKYKDILINDPALQDYVLQNPQVIDEILQHFAEINNEYSDYNNENSLIDLDSVKKNYNDLLQNVKEIVAENERSLFDWDKIAAGIQTFFQDIYEDVLSLGLDVYQVFFSEAKKEIVTINSEFKIILSQDHELKERKKLQLDIDSASINKNKEEGFLAASLFSCFTFFECFGVEEDNGSSKLHSDVKHSPCRKPSI